jgi:hypothetical protein
MLGGLLRVISMLLHPSGRDLTSVLNSSWAPVHALAVASLILILIGLVGLYAKQSEKCGILGLIGFGVAFIGTVLVTGLLYFEAFIMPVLAIEAPALVDEKGPIFTGPTGIIFPVSLMAFMLGYLIFGIATIRAKLLSRWGTLLIIIGAVLFGIGPLLVQIVVVAGAVVFGIGIFWLGYDLWKE